MNGFTKLFQSILTSSVWSEDNETRIVWITLLALADQNGHVGATIPGLSRLAGVPIPAVEAALAKFQSPDPYSRTPDFEGRRIIKQEGGWILVNYLKYRLKRDEEQRREQVKQAVKRFREKNKQANNQGENGAGGCNQGVINGNQCNHDVISGNPLKAQAEAEAEAEAETPLSPLKGGMSGSQANADELPLADLKPSDPLPKKSQRMASARPVLHLLNECAGRQFRETEANLLLIAARLEEPGVTLEGVLQMVRRQCALWRPDPQMSEYLRPETLFRRSKFESYYANREQPTDHRNGANGNSSRSGGSRAPGDDRNRFICGADDVQRAVLAHAEEQRKRFADPNYLPFGAEPEPHVSPVASGAR